MMLHGMGYALGDATSSAGWGQMTDLMRQMMWPYQVGFGRTFWQFHPVLELITWLLIIALLVAAVRWLWKKGNK